MDTPFEEVLEKAKAGDPKAQTEVRTSVHGEAQGARDRLVLSMLAGRGYSLPAPAMCGPSCVGFPCLWCVAFLPTTLRGTRTCSPLSSSHLNLGITSSDASPASRLSA